MPSDDRPTTRPPTGAEDPPGPLVDRRTAAAPPAARGGPAPPTIAPLPPDDRPAAQVPGRRRRVAGLLGWLGGLLLLAALIAVIVHRTELEGFARLVQRARPAWLLAGLALQAATYLCAAATLRRSLAARGIRQPFARLVRLSLAKLFTDQAVPTVGLSGALLVVGSLARRGVPRGLSIAAMLAGLIAYDLAYAAVVLVALGLLWRLGELTPALLAVAAAFGVVTAAAPLALLGVRGGLARRLPRRLGRLRPVREALAALRGVPPGSLGGPRLLAELTALQLAVFLLDAGTLGCMLLAVADAAGPGVVLASFAMASVAATLGVVPGGLGTFDAACVAMLHWHGVSLEAALAATLLLRGLRFWLPMIPGLWLAHRELRAPGAGEGP